MSNNPPESAAGTPSLSFLIVEDERVVARDLKACLEGLGYTVLAMVATGEAAIQKARALRPDLILMDIRLEGALDGITASQQIWAEFQIPSIYTTGYSDQATVDRATEGTLFGYILKPVRERDLYIAIKTALQRQDERQSLDQSVSSEALNVLRAIGDGVIVTDDQGRVKFLNDVAIVLTGWTLEEAQMQPSETVFRLLHFQTLEPIPCPVRRVIATGQPVHLIDPMLLVTYSGQQLPIVDSAAPLRGLDGALRGVVVVFRDVTEQELVQALAISQQRSQILEEQLNDVQKLQEQTEDFLNAASHELRTPLTSIKLAIHMLEMNLNRSRLLPVGAKSGKFTETLQEEPEVDTATQSARLSRYLTILRTECDRELRLVNELLEIQRLDAGRVPLKWENIPLMKWLQERLDPFQARALERGQLLLLRVPNDRFTTRSGGLLYLRSDQELLTRILDELLSNACKYTPPGGQITVKVVPSDDAKEPFQLSVSNTGSIIPSDAIACLFDKFYRVPGGDRWQQGGTGLGLTLVKRQVAILGGEITVKSDLQLTVFTISLPLHSDPHR